MEISRKKGDAVIPPPEGDDVFINPRNENPLDFIILDLETLLFIAKPGISPKDKARAKYTVEILKLNARAC
ncbi:hypothetical protein E1189_04095 [Sansalvadorimonas verongulae]|nr:hypothetical protein [Sansalvadorimonas verongulae]